MNALTSMSTTTTTDLELTREHLKEARAFVIARSAPAEPREGDLLFVYGTLKRAFNNHYLLGNAEFKGNAVTDQSYPFEFICLLPLPGHGMQVKGELYVVPLQRWRDLDMLEGHPNGYRRLMVDVTTADGVPHKAWIYFYLHFSAGDCMQCCSEFTGSFTGSRF